MNICIIIKLQRFDKNLPNPWLPELQLWWWA